MKKGASNKPYLGKKSVLESKDSIIETISYFKTIFIITSLGGGTGTGATPEILKITQNLGISTIVIVTLPFRFEGKRRAKQAQIGLKEIINITWNVLVFKNQSIIEKYGDSNFRTAFHRVDFEVTQILKNAIIL